MSGVREMSTEENHMTEYLQYMQTITLAFPIRIQTLILRRMLLDSKVFRDNNPYLEDSNDIVQDDTTDGGDENSTKLPPLPGDILVLRTQLKENYIKKCIPNMIMNTPLPERATILNDDDEYYFDVVQPKKKVENSLGDLTIQDKPKSESEPESETIRLIRRYIYYLNENDISRRTQVYYKCYLGEQLERFEEENKRLTRERYLDLLRSHRIDTSGYIYTQCKNLWTLFCEYPLLLEMDFTLNQLGDKKFSDYLSKNSTVANGQLMDGTTGDCFKEIFPFRIL